MKLAIITINNSDDYQQWKTADADYIAFVPHDMYLDDQYFYNLVKVYEDRPAYRKISIVSPTVSIPAIDIFSWSINEVSYEPVVKKASREPYAVQIAYLPGAVIKKKALEKIDPAFTEDDLQNSIDFSLALWASGLRCFVDPTNAIESNDFTLETPWAYAHNESEHRVLQDMFKREYIR